MCLDLDNFVDLIDKKSFKKEDIIVIQDPKKPREINLAKMSLAKNVIEEIDSTFGINIPKDTQKVYDELKKFDEEKKRLKRSNILYTSQSRGEGTMSSGLTSTTMPIIKKDKKLLNNEIQEAKLYIKVKKKKKKRKKAYQEWSSSPWGKSPSDPPPIYRARSGRSPSIPDRSRPPYRCSTAG